MNVVLLLSNYITIQSATITNISMSPKFSNPILSPCCLCCPYPSSTPPSGSGDVAPGYASTATNTCTGKTRYAKK